MAPQPLQAHTITANVTPDYSLAKLIIAAARKHASLDLKFLPGLTKQDFVIDIIFSIEKDAYQVAHHLMYW